MWSCGSDTEGRVLGVVLFLGSALTCYVTSSQTLALSGSQFSHVHKEDWMSSCGAPPPQSFLCCFPCDIPVTAWCNWGI